MAKYAKQLLFFDDINRTLDSLSGNKLTDQQLEEKYLCENSFYYFSCKAWGATRGENSFIPSYHLQVICEHLEALYRLDIDRLIINLPPRLGKSTICSVFFQPWVWINNPRLCFLYTSYKEALSVRDSVYARRLIKSDWYQSLWGTDYKMTLDVNNKLRFENSLGGYRISSSVNGGNTGEGGHFEVCDDPNDVKNKESTVVREGTNDWHDFVMSSRYVAPYNTFRRLVIQQRVHMRDLSGHLLSKNGDWVHLMLPYEFMPAYRSITIPLRMSEGKVWRDPRKKDKELLAPHWISEKEIKKIKEQDLRGDIYAFAGQYQQLPSPPDGGIFKREWFCLHTENDYPTFNYVLQSWDTALVGKHSSTSPSTLCYSACTTWGIFRGHNNVPNVFLISLYKGQLEYPDLRKMVVRLAHNYYDTDFEDATPPKVCHKSDLVLIESKGSGYTLASELMSTGIPIMRFDPTGFGDKQARAQRITDIIENGQLWLPTDPPHNQQPNAYAKQLVKDCLLFPKGESNDTIDSMSQALIRLKQTNWLYHPDNPTFEQPLRLERSRQINMRRKLGL